MIFFPFEEPQKKAESYLSLMEIELQIDQRCLKNYRDLHGTDPHPAMNMTAIRRDYDLPWRKTSIPAVARKRRGVTTAIQ